MDSTLHRKRAERDTIMKRELVESYFDWNELWTIIDRIISARHAVEAYISREMYIRGFLDYERLVCDVERDV